MPVPGQYLRHRPGLALTIRENRPPRTSSGSVELGVSPPILATLRYPLLVASRSRSQSSPGLSEHRPGSRRTAGPIDGVRIPVLDCVRRGLAAGWPRCGSAAPCHTATEGTTGASANKKAHLVGGRHCAQIVLNSERQGTTANVMPRQKPNGFLGIWSGREDSNLRPLGPEPSALPG